MRSCISSGMGGRPGFLRDFQRQYNRNAAVCHLLTVAGCMRWTCWVHPLQDFDSTTQRNRNACVNLGLRCFLWWMRSVQAANWLSAARSRAANAALGRNSARRNVPA